MEKIKYDLDKTQLIINQIIENIDKMNLNINNIYNDINKIDENLVWVSNNSLYVKNKGLSIVNGMEKEISSLRTLIKQIEKNTRNFKDVDYEILKEFKNND